MGSSIIYTSITDSTIYRVLHVSTISSRTLIVMSTIKGIIRHRFREYVRTVNMTVTIFISSVIKSIIVPWIPSISVLTCTIISTKHWNTMLNIFTISITHIIFSTLSFKVLITSTNFVFISIQSLVIRTRVDIITSNFTSMSIFVIIEYTPVEWLVTFMTTTM